MHAFIYFQIIQNFFNNHSQSPGSYPLVFVIIALTNKKSAVFKIILFEIVFDMLHCFRVQIDDFFVISALPLNECCLSDQINIFDVQTGNLHLS